MMGKVTDGKLAEKMSNKSSVDPEAELVGAADRGASAYYAAAGWGKPIGVVVAALVAGGIARWLLSHQNYFPGSIFVFLSLFILSTLYSTTHWGVVSRVRSEAKGLARQAGKLLKKHRAKIEAPAAAEVEQGIARVETALAGSAALPALEAREALDNLLDRHLGFARKSAARDYTESIGGAILAALILRAFVFEPFHIPSGSMIPTLLVGDFIFVNKMAYGLRIPFTDPAKVHKVAERAPERGDVIVFMVPASPDVDYVKRVVGLPGDRIEVRDNQVWVNGVLQPRVDLGDFTYVERSEYTDSEAEVTAQRFQEDLGGRKHEILARRESGLMHLDHSGAWTVQPGRVFVMGDNRDNSRDSRVENGVGQIPFSYIKGRASVIWISFGGPQEIRFERMFQSVR